MKVKICSLALTLFASACASAPLGHKLRVIDAHTHTSFDGEPEETSGIPDTQEQYFKEWREAGVVAAVSHEGWHEESDELDVSDVFSNPKIFVCAGVRDPAKDRARIEKGLAQKKYRCIKIYLGYVHRWASDPGYVVLYRLAEKYNVPVVFHTGDTYDTKGKLKYADPLTVDEVAVDHPKVRFVIAHAGNPWIQTAAEVAYKNPNVYLDGSALLIGDLSQTPEDKVDDYVVAPIAWMFGYMENPKKLMFGTDWPLTNIRPYLEAFKRAIPREHWDDVFYNNAKTVFGFPDTP